MEGSAGLPSMTAGEAAARGLVVIGRHAYDAGPFLGEHPGGAEALARWMGRGDATAAIVAAPPQQQQQQHQQQQQTAAGTTPYLLLLTAVAAALVAAAIVLLR
jgi:hypothetical protein